MMVSLAEQPPEGIGLRYKGVLSGAHVGTSRLEGRGDRPCVHHGH
jgi:hypothetical protein